MFPFLKSTRTRQSKLKYLIKKMNRGGGYGLEVPVIYYFTGPEKLVNWIEEKLIHCKQNLGKKNKKMLEIDSLKSLITCITCILMS